MNFHFDGLPGYSCNSNSCDFPKTYGKTLMQEQGKAIARKA